MAHHPPGRPPTLPAGETDPQDPYLATDLAHSLHNLNIHENVDQSYTNYDYQPFVPYSITPGYTISQSAYPNYSYSPVPYLLEAPSYPNRPLNVRPSQSISPTPAFPIPAGPVWHSPPVSPATYTPDFQQPRYNPPQPWRNTHAAAAASTPPAGREPPPTRPREARQPTKEEKERERKAYHPQAPIRRSDWVMWVGNVPSNTTHEELWRFFNTPLPSEGDTPWRGPSSIFLISRSSCAFVNLSSQQDLDRAISFFNSRSLRPWDPRCPRLVCRVRRKDDDLRAGVGAQRGTGMHRQWVKQQRLQEPKLEEDVQRKDSTDVVDTESTRHMSSTSCASTNSSFLARNFPLRAFILKSLTIPELEESVKTGTWQTQRHNEPVLNQAFRTSAEVFLIFGANRSGEFFGYAKMIEPIDKESYQKRVNAKAKSTLLKAEERGAGGTRRDSEPPTYFLTPSADEIPASPKQLTADEELLFSSSRLEDDDYGPSDAPRAHTHPNPTTRPPQVQPPGTRSLEYGIQRPIARDTLGSLPEKDVTDGILRKDTTRKDTIKEEEDQEGWGTRFRIQWIRVGRMPFSHTRHLRNPWNADREVKVSRDGTEVEPSVAVQLMAQWDKIYPPNAAV